MKNYITPWFTIWYKPVETVERVLNAKHQKAILFLIFIMGSLASFGESAYVLSYLRLGSPFATKVSFFSEHLFITALLTFSVLSLLYALILVLSASLIYWIAKLFKGKANYKTVLVVILLSIIPDVVSSLLDYMGGFASTMGIAISWLGLILFIIMFSHVEKFCTWKTFTVFGIIIGLIIYLSYPYFKHESSNILESNTTKTLG